MPLTKTGQIQDPGTSNTKRAVIGKPTSTAASIPAPLSVASLMLGNDVDNTALQLSIKSLLDSQNSVIGYLQSQAKVGGTPLGPQSVTAAAAAGGVMLTWKDEISGATPQVYQIWSADAGTRNVPTFPTFASAIRVAKVVAFNPGGTGSTFYPYGSLYKWFDNDFVLTNPSNPPRRTYFVTTIDNRGNESSIGVQATGSPIEVLPAGFPIRWFNVLAYGATGDNVADDTTAFQNAFNDVPAVGGVVYIPTPPVKYKITSQLTPKANTYIFGDVGASVINFNVTDIALGATGLSNVWIDGLVFQGTAGRMVSLTTPTNCSVSRCNISGATLDPGAAQLTAGIYMTGATNCRVEDNTLSGNGNFPTLQTAADIKFYATANTDNIIRNNRCTSSGVVFNIIVFNGVKTLIQGNIVANAQQSGASLGYGIATYDSAGSPERNIIVGNSVDNTGGTGIYIANCPRTTVSGNVVRNAGLTQTDGTLPVGGIAVHGTSGFSVVVGNTVLSGGGAGASGITNSSNDVEIIGNTISGATARPGVYLRIGNNVTVSKNRITNCFHGISDNGLNNAVAGIVCTDNTIDLTASTTSGILHGGWSNSVIARNIISKSSQYGINSAAGALNLIADNVVTDSSQQTTNTYDGILNQSNNTTIARNISVNSAGATQRYGIWNTGTGCRAFQNDVSVNQTAGFNPASTAFLDRYSNRLSAGASQGVAVLVGGTKLVNTAEIQVGDLVSLTNNLVGGAVGTLSLGAIVGGTSFVINSSSGTDTSTVFWKIWH